MVPGLRALIREMFRHVIGLLIGSWMVAVVCTCEPPSGGSVRDHADLNLAGVQALGKGELDEAVDFFGRANAIQPQNPEYLNNLGVVALRRNQVNEAAQYFTRATIADATYTRAHYNLGVAYQALKNDPLAIAAYKRTLELQSDAVEAYFNLGIVYSRSGKKPEALESYKKFVARATPDYVRQIEDAKKKIRELESK